MFEIHVTVSCPDLLSAAELVIGKKNSTPPQVIKSATTSAAPGPASAAPASVIPAAAPVAPPAAAPVSVSAASAPVSPAPVAAAPVYTLAQIAKAGADLMASNPGLQPALVELIHRYGAQTVQELPQDKLGAFATELRQMGARI